MRVALETLGCRVNEAELERWAREFRAAGHRIVPGGNDPDLVIVNSCAVTQEAVRKSRGLLRRIHREQPAAKLVLTGCYATLDAPEAGALGVDLVVANAEKERMVEIVERELTLTTTPIMAAEPELGSLLPSNRQRAFVKVQDGCRYRCTFCIVTVARGDERSVKPADVITEINQLHAGGIDEVVLTGVHLGGYGSDLDLGLDHLIAAVLEQTSIPRIRFGSIEPWDLPDSLFTAFQDPRLMPHLHLPLQSGCDATLRRMARRCRTKDFRSLLDRLRTLLPDLNVTTDIIVGFPGETDSEWQESLDFIQTCGFGHLHIFPYSPRNGTRAATLPSTPSGSTVKERCAELREIGADMRRDVQHRFLGRRFQVLLEGDLPAEGQTGGLQGYTPNYLRVELADAPRRTATLTSRIIEAKLCAIDEASGRLIARSAD